MKALIELENMEFFAGHGCYEMEKVVGNRFLVSVSMEAEVTDAVAHDDVNKSVNYLNVYEVVRGQMQSPSNIIENVAARIIDAIREHFHQVEKVTVKVSKLAPPLGGKIEKVSVTLVS